MFMVLLEDGSLIELKKRFIDGVYTQISNGSGIKSEQRELMGISEALKIAKREQIRGVLTKIVKHGNKYLVYYKYNNKQNNYENEKDN